MRGEHTRTGPGPTLAEQGPDWHLRALAPAEAASVAQLIRTAFATMLAAIEPPPSALRETAEGVATILAAGGGAGVEAGGALVAAALWQPGDDGLHVSRVSVLPGWRGRGMARRLIAAAEAEARRRGLSRLLLSTRLALIDNRRLFADCGFRETALHSHPGYGVPTFVDMEKVLV